MATWLIGDLAKRAGVTPQTIRYYERLGLLPRPLRSASGYRRYDERAWRDLAFIKRAQALGFSLEEIKEVLQMARAGRAPCQRVLDLAERHVAELDRRLAELAALRDRLTAALARWKRGGVPAECATSLCGLIAGVEEGNPTGLAPAGRQARETGGRRPFERR
jgi:DNA-binding transcriptional MerR regulator